MKKILNNLSVVIMAAGKGTRMNSNIPKVLYPLAGKTLLNHVVDTAQSLYPQYTVIIIGYKSDLVKKSINKNNIYFSSQNKQKGTGHAVMQCEEHLKNFKGQTLVLSGDVPLIKQRTLLSLFEKQINNNFDACMLTADMNNPSGYGRIIRDENGDLKEVKEDKDCNDEELQIKEINSGIYIFDNQLLFDLLPKLDNSNAQSEYYLPDVLSMIIKDKGKIGLEKIANIIEIQGVNTTEQLLYLEKNYEKYVL